MRVGDWFLFVLHNCAVHPMLPVAVLLTTSDHPTLRKVGEAVFWAHDVTAPLS